MTDHCAVIELRRYRLRPRMRETLIELFEAEFIESQEAAGIRVIGQFRDLDEPDHFVWLRGFRDMSARTKALAAFYGGPVWARYRDEANRTMINSDNVLLLRPAAEESGFALAAARPGATGASGTGNGVVVSTLCHLAPNTEDAFTELFQREMRPLLTKTSARVLASYVTERSLNGFPKLPVREGETVFVWFASFATLEAYQSHLAELDALGESSRKALDGIDQRVWCRNEISRLVPTARSVLQL